MAEDKRRDEQRPIEDERLPYEEKFRRFLLGLCEPEESAEVERGIFEEEHPILEVIEDELVEEYVTGDLNETDRSHFEERFLFSQERLEKIRLSAMLLGRPDVAEDLRRRVENLRQKLAPYAVPKHALQDLSEEGMQYQSFDRPYVERLRSGDFRTAKHFVTYFSKLIQLKLRSRVRTPQDIEDLRQEIFTRVLTAVRSPHGIRQPDRLGGFVNSVCNHVLLEYEQSRKTLLEEKSSSMPAGDVLGTLAAAEQVDEKVREILEEMPERDQRILREVFLEERDKDAVCRKYGVDREYLRILLHRIKTAYSESTPMRSRQKLVVGAEEMQVLDNAGSARVAAEPTDLRMMGAMTRPGGVEPDLGSSATSIQPAALTKRTGARTWIAVAAPALLGVLAVFTYSVAHYQLRSPPPRPPIAGSNLMPYLVSAEVAEVSRQTAYYRPPPPGYRHYTLTVKGLGFVKGSAVLWNGSFVPTILVRSTELFADIDSSVYDKNRGGQVVVVNPPPGGGASSPVKVRVVESTP